MLTRSQKCYCLLKVCLFVFVAKAFVSIVYVVIGSKNEVKSSPAITLSVKAQLPDLGNEANGIYGADEAHAHDGPRVANVAHGFHVPYKFDVQPEKNKLHMTMAHVTNVAHVTNEPHIASVAHVTDKPHEILWTEDDSLNTESLPDEKGIPWLNMKDEGEDEAWLEREIAADEARLQPALGHGGLPAFLTGEEKILGENSVSEQGMNVVLSDRIPYDRHIRELRHPSCLSMEYGARLPSVSVVIIFCEEPYSALLRTVHSALRNSATHRRNATHLKNMTFEHIIEVILVDDNSQRRDLGHKLDYYVRTRLPPGLVSVIRMPQRVGLAMARVAGARAARGQALVYLDAHCETAAGWLPPLLHHLTLHPAGVALPVLDFINFRDFNYNISPNLWVGDFSYTGYFKWINIPLEEQKRLTSDIGPVRSAAMAGGVYAIMRRRFFELGGYDAGFAGWGGDDIEMSFKVWMCGGTLEVLPCSRVGHVERLFHPYTLHPDTAALNIARVVEVWTDEYKEIFRWYLPSIRKHTLGDLQKQIELRQKLQCHSFRWYLEHICPYKVVPVRDSKFFGRFRNARSGLCLQDVPQGERLELGLQPCSNALLQEQDFQLTLSGALLRDDVMCAATAPATPNTSGEKDPVQIKKLGLRVIFEDCDWRAPLPSQRWELDAGLQLRHVSSGLCVQAGRAGLATLTHCTPRHTQRWQPEFLLGESESPDINAAIAKIRLSQKLS